MIKIYLKYLFLTLLLFCGMELCAQADKNPFELNTRIPALEEKEIVQEKEIIENVIPVPTVLEEETVDITEKTEAVEEITNEEQLVIDPNNPFELIAPTAKSTAIIKDKPTTIVPAPSKKTSPFQPTQAVSKDRGALFGIILGLSLLLAFLFAGFRSSFNKAYQNITNSSILKQSYREMSTIGQLPLNIWYVFSWISIGTFIFLLMRYYGLGLSTSTLGNFAYSVGIISVLMLLKHAVLFFIGTIFPVQKEVQLYNFLVIIFGVALGVALVPANIFIAYLANDLVSYAIYIALAIVVILYLLRAFRGLMISNRLLTFHRFHFLLYICAVEIAPVIILLKLGFLSAGK